MNISMAHHNRCNVEAHPSSNSEALSLFMSKLIASASTIEIVSDNAKKRAYDCKIKRQCSRLSLRRNQRWNGGSDAGSISAPSSSSSSSCNTTMTDPPQRLKSLERRESSSSEFSWDAGDDDFDDICSNASLDTFDSSFRSCDSLGAKDQPLSPVLTYEHTLQMVQQKLDSLTTSSRMV